MGCSAAVCLLRATGNWKEGNDWKEWIRSQGALRGQQLARSSKQSPPSSFLVCHCVSVCFFDQSICCQVVRVNYFASTPSLQILVSSKANVTLPVLQNLATRAFKDCLIASGWSNTGGGGGQAWDLPWDDHCCVKQPVGPLWGSVSLSHSVTPCDIMTSGDLCQCHTLWYCDKWGTFRRAGILLEGQGTGSEREVWKGVFFLLGQFRNITNLLAHTRSAPSKAALALN